MALPKIVKLLRRHPLGQPFADASFLQRADMAVDVSPVVHSVSTHGVADFLR